MIHTRSQLIDWIGMNVDDPVIQTALCDGEVECLGGFAPLPTSENSGWLAKITTRFRTVYLIAVATDRKRLGQFYWFRAPCVEWENWIGDTTKSRLFAGDKPDDYREFKDAVSDCTRDREAYLPTDRRKGEARACSRLDQERRDQDV